MENNYYKKTFTTESLGTPSLIVHYFGFEQCLPAQSWGPNSRDHYLIHYIISGKGTFTVKNKTIELKEGDVFLSRPSDRIFYKADSLAPWEYCWVGFTGTEIPTLLSHTDFNNGHFFNIKDSYRKRLLAAYNSFFKSKGFTYDKILRIQSSFYNFIALLAEISNDLSVHESKNITPFEKAAMYIASKLSSESLNIEDIANHICVSKSTLFRIFMNNVEMSPQKYIIESRMRYAIELMKLHTMPIKEIALSTGFSNQLYFSTYFKKFFGESPSDFMKNHSFHKKEPIKTFRPYIPPPISK